MSILSVDNISPIGSGTSVTINNAATLVVNNVNVSGVTTCGSTVSVAGVTTITGANGNLLNVNHTDGGGAQGVIRTKASQANSSSFIRAEDSGTTYIGLLKYGTGHSAYGALGAGDGAIYANSGGGNDTNITIMADSSTGIIKFATGGNSEKVRINSSGYVGINSTSPAAYLDIGAHNTGNPTLRVRNHTSAGAFVNNYGSEFRHTFNSMNHGMLIHTQEAADARRTLDISDANGIFATFTNGKVGLGGLTTPSAKLHALDSSSTTTTILKLRNYASSVNTKPRMAFEASTSAGQGANSYIQGLAGTDAAGSNSNNESGLEFIVTYGGSGTERSAMKLDHDGVCTVPRQPKFNIRCNTNNTFGQGGNYNTNYLSPIPTFTPGNRTELTMRAFDVTYPSYAGGNYPKIVVPVDGFYMFGFAGCYFIQNSSDFVGFGFNVNNEGNANTGSPTYLISSAQSNNNYYDIVHNISGSVGIQLSANDFVVLYQWSSTSGRFDGNVHLYGYLVG